MAAVQSSFSAFTSALRTNDFVQLGFNSRDLFRSFRALVHCFSFIQVKALLENRIELSFLFEGSSNRASPQISPASLYFPSFRSSLPFSLSCSPFLALLYVFLSFSLSGSYLSPSMKYFFALPLSPEQSSISPLKQLMSPVDAPLPSAFLSTFLASSVSPVLARSSHLINNRSGLFCTLPRMQLTDKRASGKLFSLMLSKICLQFFCSAWQSSISLWVVRSLSMAREALKSDIDSSNLRRFIQARALLLKALAKLGSSARALLQSSMVLSNFLRLRQQAALLLQQEASLLLIWMAWVQQRMASENPLFLKWLLPSSFQSFADFSMFMRCDVM